MGFEPTRRLNTAYAISSRAPSANSDTSPYNEEFIKWRRERRTTQKVSVRLLYLMERLRRFRIRNHMPNAPTPMIAHPPKPALVSPYSSS